MNIIHGGIILIVYTFVVFAAYIFISSPFDNIMTSFENVNMTASDSHIENVGGTVRTVFDMCFAALALGPIIWFVYWVFHREPHWGYR